MGHVDHVDIDDFLLRPARAAEHRGVSYEIGVLPSRLFKPEDHFVVRLRQHRRVVSGLAFIQLTRQFLVDREYTRRCFGEKWKWHQTSFSGVEGKILLYDFLGRSVGTIALKQES